MRAIVDAFLSSPAGATAATERRWAVQWTGDLAVNTGIIDKVLTSMANTSVIPGASDGTAAAGSGEAADSCLRSDESAAKDRRDVLVAVEAPDPFVFVDGVLRL